MPLDSLRSAARRILGMIEDILRACEPPIDPQHLADLRKRLALAQSHFFAEQEQVLLVPLRGSGDPALAAIARCCVERDLDIRRMGLVHYQRWPLSKVVEDPAAYRAGLQNILRTMEGRVLYGEQTAYPALTRLISTPQQSADR
ncbi:hypothetical protein [Sphingomonas sp. R1]|uniref:hypothetical protein n=1 Tax=Sphingomonas sp. R1 TaxID=399176 RepID=UPI0022257EC3|nr:hypothetical protein [Sphingomonas sp. R1]UYY76950.1 hypothetical protein OIM94_15825 [Sphingomonas sp. R1]